MAMTGIAMTGMATISTISVARASQKVGALRCDVKSAPASVMLAQNVEGVHWSLLTSQSVCLVMQASAIACS